MYFNSLNSCVIAYLINQVDYNETFANVCYIRVRIQEEWSLVWL